MSRFIVFRSIQRSLRSCRLLPPMMLCVLAFSQCLTDVYPHANAQDAATEKNPLTQILDQVWDFELTEYPQLATDVGDPRGQDRLAKHALADYQRRDQMRAKFLERLLEIDPLTLPVSERIDWDLVVRKLESEREDYRLKLHLMPINNREGFHIGLPELPRVMNPDSVEDMRNYISRLNELPRFVDEQIALMDAGIKAGLVQPAIIMRDSAEQAGAQVVADPKQSLFYKNLESIDKLDKADWQEVEPDLLLAIKQSVIPSYAKFQTYLAETYVPACRENIAARTLPGGKAFYQSQIRKFTTLDLSPEELHQTGIRENARIRREMEQIRESVGFEGDLPAFIEHLRTDPKFYPKTADELMREVSYICKQVDGRLPTLFGRLPSTPYGIRKIPDYVAPQTTSAYYWPPSTDGSRAGFYYINTYNLASRPMYQLEALSFHEAVPGHHLQLAIQAELQGLHPLRRQSYFSAFIEGWALYSERLGKEMGFYTDPYQDFGRLSMEAWRASRLVVDTGIHALGWTRKQAIDYMAENTALSRHNIVAEVDRYIGWPGQALAYKTGEIFIRKQRERAEEALGDRFDIRKFHEVVLENGSIPLPLLQAQIDQYIDNP